MTPRVRGLAFISLPRPLSRKTQMNREVQAACASDLNGSFRRTRPNKLRWRCFNGFFYHGFCGYRLHTKPNRDFLLTTSALLSRCCLATRHDLFKECAAGKVDEGRMNTQEAVEG